jgi:hypothetical protein
MAFALSVQKNYIRNTIKKYNKAFTFYMIIIDSSYL